MNRSIQILVALSVIGCSSPDFDPPHRINTWRVLAMVAEPPEIRAGDGAVIRVLLTDPEGVTVRDPDSRGLTFAWRVCLAPELLPGSDGAQYSPEDPTLACDGVDPAGRFPLEGDGVSALLPGEVTALADQNLDVLRAIAGDFLPEDILR